MKVHFILTGEQEVKDIDAIILEEYYKNAPAIEELRKKYSQGADQISQAIPKPYSHNLEQRIVDAHRKETEVASFFEHLLTGYNRGSNDEIKALQHIRDAFSCLTSVLANKIYQPKKDAKYPYIPAHMKGEVSQTDNTAQIMRAEQAKNHSAYRFDE